MDIIYPPLPSALPPRQDKAEAMKKERIKQELIQAGMTAYGLHKFDTYYLPTIIHDYEHIGGVIYGRFSEGPGLLNWVDRMIVATEGRIISLNHKPGYTDVDEFTYDSLISVDDSIAGPFTAVTLRTLLECFTVRFVNKTCAEKFVSFVEKKRLEYALPRQNSL